MSKIRTVLDKFPLRVVLCVGLPIILVCVSVLIISLRGSLNSIIRFERVDIPGLTADSDMSGWASLDKDSYFLGQHAQARIRVLYRDDRVKPDFDKFKRDMGFFPFDQLGLSESQSDIGNGITEYILDYKLHVIGVRKPGSYALKPAVLFYSRIQDDAGSNLHTLRILRPDLHLASFYPWSAGTISLRGIREQIFNQNPLRQTVMLLGGLVLLGLAAFLLWRFGYRRHQAELTEPEQLWYQFRQINNHIKDNRLYLLRCEKIFTRLLQHQISMDPEMFWSGDEPVDESWCKTVNKAREILRRVYQAGEIADDDVHQMNSLLAERLALAVEGQRLELEQHPSFISRIMQQRRVAQLTGIITAISISMLILAGLPDLWLAPEIKKYNETVVRIQSGQGSVENLLLDLQAFAGSARIQKIRAAAFYNSGTTRAANSFGDLAPAAQLQILDLVFQAESADALLQTLLLAELSGSEEEVVTMFVNAAERLLQSELDLQSATRIISGDEEILRNLELATKRRHALLTRLVQLRDLFKMNAMSGTDEDILSDQGLVNIIDAKLPEEYEDAEMAKDNSSYIIFERF